MAVVTMVLMADVVETVVADTQVAAMTTMIAVVAMVHMADVVT
jgi:hypothetical protein